MADSIFSCRHPRGHVGSIDESERKFFRDELPTAQKLAAEGHNVSALKEGPKYGPRGDASVCGQPTEFKRLRRPEQDTPPASRVRNRVNSSDGQSPRVIIDARNDKRITSKEADAGVRAGIGYETRDRKAGTLKGEEKTGVRVIGSGFDRSYDRTDLARIRADNAKRQQPGASTAPQPPHAPRKVKGAGTQPAAGREPGGTAAASQSRFATNRDQDPKNKYAVDKPTKKAPADKAKREQSGAGDAPQPPQASGKAKDAGNQPAAGREPGGAAAPSQSRFATNRDQDPKNKYAISKPAEKAPTDKKPGK